MAEKRLSRWKTILDIVVYAMFFMAWIIFWLVSLYGCLPFNYLLSFIPLLFALWKLTKGMPNKFIWGFTSVLFIFFVVFDFLNGTIPQQMNIAVKYNAEAVFNQWGRSLMVIGVGNYIFDTLVDSMMGLLVVAFVWRIIKLFREVSQQPAVAEDNNESQR